MIRTVLHVLLQVEGCASIISAQKAYYKRYHICEAHMKRLALLIDGTAHRFCQQCARLQPVTDFDGQKR